jgi:hypothetical protein
MNINSHTHALTDTHTRTHAQTYTHIFMRVHHKQANKSWISTTHLSPRCQPTTRCIDIIGSELQQHVASGGFEAWSTRIRSAHSSQFQPGPAASVCALVNPHIVDVFFSWKCRECQCYLRCTGWRNYPLAICSIRIVTGAWPIAYCATRWRQCAAQCASNTRQGLRKYAQSQSYDVTLIDITGHICKTQLVFKQTKGKCLLSA